MKLNYEELTTIEEWNEVLRHSDKEPVLLLKHSTACPISGAAYGEFTVYARKPKRKLSCVMVKVIESRSVSNQMTADLGTKHESPQIFLIHRREVLWHASHWTITYERIEQEVNSRLRA
ncbi:bacillithiol system redox-active protein YtxJ [Paenibacillus sp. GCM10023252]|uniref:bacillithiol system redox-active protein YtxJ n=1 Tax=Paenibacillus sp. GCM10023252 TaxID=3252649 RepID=UPI0036086A1D